MDDLFLSTLPARGATEWALDHWDDYVFLSTLPARGATWRGALAPAVAGISIHAPREGSDRQNENVVQAEGDFYPRSPRGERRKSVDPMTKQVYISIHAPREGSDISMISVQSA